MEILKIKKALWNLETKERNKNQWKQKWFSDANFVNKW